MTNEEMFNLLKEFKEFIRHTGKVSPKFYPVVEQIISTFYMWYADRKLQK